MYNTRSYASDSVPASPDCSSKNAAELHMSDACTALRAEAASGFLNFLALKIKSLNCADISDHRAHAQDARDFPFSQDLKRRAAYRETRADDSGMVLTSRPALKVLKLVLPSVHVSCNTPHLLGACYHFPVWYVFGANRRMHTEQKMMSTGPAEQSATRWQHRGVLKSADLGIVQRQYPPSPISGSGSSSHRTLHIVTG